ncbi:calcium-binding protein [Conexibacter sp. JD483]|uniref:calcium-binding protein n=1 Tax=unclassified Conexibacter TaxID=2627773 RepID=UPI002716A648|nr:MULTISPECIES: calcium-binding protein [unclassified Conexibacter]MDO8187118.1 calcium-binding protein [Conexibacter sp. CPCC 205706]MDO8200294.1 calcium-binding protein [Conexibacter sp. CPCC 205762]MDR9368910.1 calcium-binding protein [Conexibacter sp. JD483]
MRQFTALLAALAAVAALPGAATASTLDGTTHEYYGGRFPYARTAIEWRGDPGETNRLEVRNVLPGMVILRDASGPIAVRGDCSALADGAAICFVKGDGADLTLAGGDGDDELRVRERAPGSVLIDGGAGNDTIDVGDATGYGFRLSGGAGDDVIRGSGGNDVIDGGPGSDRIDAGEGSDSVIEDEQPYAADQLDGGAGTGDTIVYTRPDPVRVDLAAGSGGQPGGEDRLRGFEEVVGTAGDDVLLGDDGPNVFNRTSGSASAAPAGADRIDGRGGDDLLFDARGPISCGAGEDTIGSPWESALVPGDCEGVADGPQSLRLDGRRLTLTFARWETWVQRACGELVTVRDTSADRRPLARAFVRLQQRQTRTLTLRLARPALLLRVRTQTMVCRRGAAPRPYSRTGRSFLYAPFSIVPPEPLQPVAPVG